MMLINLRRRLQSGALMLCLLLPVAASAEKAADFVLPNADGKLVSLSDYRGRPLVLHFWATWCPYCKKLQPGLDALVNDYADEGLVVLGISFREDEGADPAGVLAKRGHSFQTLVEGDEVASLYGVKGTPTTFFIDRRGEVVAMTHSSDPKDPALERGAELAIK